MAFDPATQVSAVRALFPLLVALASLAIVPLVRSERFGPPEGAAKRASDTVTVLLVLSGIGALIAGASYASTAQFGSVRIDPSEPGRLLAALGGPVFALIVAIGEGRRVGTMGQIALFGIAVIDLALALPIGIAPIALLLFSSLAIGAAAAGGKDDPARARAVFRDLRTAALLLPAIVIAEIFRSSISLSATDPSYATPASLGAGAVLALSLVAVGSVGAFPFHQRLIRTFESLPIVGSLLVGVWIPTAVSLVVMGEIGTITATIVEPISGAIAPALLLAGAAALLLGAVAALLHDDIGEIVGFMAVGNAGWISIALAAAIAAPADASSRLLAVPGALTMSLFGLWLIALRRRYDTSLLSALGGWARRTAANGVVLSAAIIALAALPPGAIIAARLRILEIDGSLLIGALAVLGHLGLIAAALRALLVGAAPVTDTVRRAKVRPAQSPMTIALMVGSLLIAGGAAGWLSIEIGGSAPLPPPASASPIPAGSPTPSPEASPSEVPSETPSASPEASPTGSASPSP